MTASSVATEIASRLRFSGLVHPNSRFHQLKDVAPADHVIAPQYVSVKGVGEIPQYAPIVFGQLVAYDPPNDCQGYFDFAGHPITDPATANWTVNQGPISQQTPGDLW